MVNEMIEDNGERKMDGKTSRAPSLIQIHDALTSASDILPEAKCGRLRRGAVGDPKGLCETN
jgi:hypothetical protein